MKKIKLVYNILGKFGPGSNASSPNTSTLELVNNNNPNSNHFIPGYLQNILNFKNNDLFELCTPYSLNYNDNFLYELPWNSFQIGEEIITEMSQNVLNGIKKENGYIIINDAVDPLSKHRIVSLLDITDKFEIPRNKIILLTGAIDFYENGNIWGIQIISSNWCELETSNRIYDFLDHKNDQPKLNKFICLNRMWHHHRLHFLWKCWKLGLLKYIDMSFLKTDPNNGCSLSEILPNNTIGFFDENEVSTIFKDAKIIDDTLLPLVVDDITKLKTHVSHSYTKDHTPYHFYVVSETTFYSFNETIGVHVSEKIFKPIVYKMPFIVIGPNGTLSALRKKGYMTFNSLIDESYDEIIDDKLRFNKIIELIKEICSKSEDELNKLSYNINEITEFNFNRLRSRHKLAREDLITNIINLYRK